MDNSKAEIEAIKNIILRTATPERIYLFGSHAYGVPQADSDYDFYVVIPDDGPQPGSVIDDIYTALYKKTNRKPVDILVKRASEFHRRAGQPTLEREVNTKGVMLYRAG